MQTFNYTGGQQIFEVPETGVYQLQCYGSMGASSISGYGGYVNGYRMCKKGEKIYINVGGRTGYNGGGIGGYDADSRRHYSGGATSMALVSGTIEQIGYEEFVTNKKGLLVAGGGGSAGLRDYYYGGGGGYPNGVSAPTSNGATYCPTGGTQTSGGTGSGGMNGAFGRGGGIGERGCQAAGGGGLFGGGGSLYNYSGGAGGSSYIDGCPSFEYKGTTYAPSFDNAYRADNGIAFISYISKGGLSGIVMNNKEISAIKAYGHDIESIKIFGRDLS